MRFLVFLIPFLYFTCLHAQELNQIKLEEMNVEKDVSSDSEMIFSMDTTKSIKGLTEKKDERIDLLIEDYIKNKKSSGYRIQIFSSSNNRWEAVKARSEFLKKYPEEKSYLIYQAPNYKVRIGDYISRLNAYERLELIKIDFPSAFIVVDDVEPEIKKSNKTE